jgi:hypothetical protein
MLEYKYKGITFKVILPEKPMGKLSGKALYEEILGEDQIALILACGSDSGEYKLSQEEKLIVHIEYTINEKEYEKSLNVHNANKEEQC